MKTSHLLISETLFTLALVTPCASDEPALVRFEFKQVHMGTEFRLVLYTPDQSSAIAASKAAFDRIGQLDAILSDYRDDSELMTVCRQAGGPPVAVGHDLFFVLERAQDLSKRSDGAFDVTVGPVVRLWRRARRMRQLPDAERLARARELVDYRMLQLDRSDRTVRLEKAGVLLDLGGIAKGYAADEALAVLKRHGVTRALVAGSGDIAVGEPPPGTNGWKIGIAPLERQKGVGSLLPERPAGCFAQKTPDPFFSPTRFLLLSNSAVSTSGDAEQFVEIGGKRYSHIVDPKTGLGLTERSSVTVVAPNGITADSLATTVSVLGPERGMKLVDSTEGAAALIVQATERGPETYESSRFKNLPLSQPQTRGPN